MSGEGERIRDQIHRAVHGDAWHGPALRELLRDVTPAEAASRPVAAAHSIWEIVLHVTAWATIARQRIESEAPPAILAGADWPAAAAAGDRAWQEAVARLESAHADLEQTAAGLSDEDLARKARGGETTAYVLLHGVIQHGLYHAGQVALLRKALGR